jgi:MraZ protein
MFISTYENKLDKKGRVSVPAAYRSYLSSQGYNSVVCYPSFTNSSIEFCPQDRLEKIIESIDTLSPFEENRDIFSTSILANSFQLNFDTDGRVTLSERLLSHTGIKEKVLFVGQGKTFQMWDPMSFKKFSDDARKKASLKRSELKWKQTN